ncbi:MULTISPECIES: 4'-phosphopantetheinyl transferase superfamily protein [unclassified Nocardia]|uniref:4'-phosphopantetheinyl transferase superfamily protein n=1 Tax=unclassified Nocardia TaxID=2637762 RepID=UPI001CE43855|nr:MULTISPECIES: 4'-phosphopantetheinyl transferase superfamily protein [unclassified Nocardia]
MTSNQLAPRWRTAGHRLAVDGMGARRIHRAGIDLGDVARIDVAVRRRGDDLARRVCTTAELAALDDPIAGLTALFSMKESVVKVLGGMPRGGRYTDIDIGPAAEVRPIALRGEFARWADRNAVTLVAGYTEVAPRLLLSWALASTEDGAR